MADQYTVMVEAEKQAVEPVLTNSPIISNAASEKELVTGDIGEGHTRSQQGQDGGTDVGAAAQLSGELSTSYPVVHNYGL
jgi:hypothetical protein